MTRTLVMGDPQAPFGKLIEILDRHGAIRDGRLASEIRHVPAGEVDLLPLAHVAHVAHVE